MCVCVCVCCVCVCVACVCVSACVCACVLLCMLVCMSVHILHLYIIVLCSAVYTCVFAMLRFTCTCVGIILHV